MKAYHDDRRGRKICGGSEPGGSSGDADELSRPQTLEVVRAEPLADRAISLVSPFQGADRELDAFGVSLRGGRDGVAPRLHERKGQHQILAGDHCRWECLQTAHI